MSSKFYVIIGWAYAAISLLFCVVSLVLAIAFFPEPSVNSSLWFDILTSLSQLLMGLLFWGSQIYIGIKVAKNSSAGRGKSLGSLFLIWTVSFAVIVITVLLTASSYLCTDCGPVDTSTGKLIIGAVSLVILVAASFRTLKFFNIDQ